MSIIKLDGISFSYLQNGPIKRAALSDVSLSLKKGEVLGIIGHTGSGKSTLVQMLNGLLKPTMGTVFLEGEDIWQNPKEIGKKRFKVGLVFQYPEHQLFEETVFKDVAFGPNNMELDEQEVSRRVLNYTELLGLNKDYLEKSPFDLSGGEKRRVALAGILAMEPEVLVLDEPTAGLDPRGREDLFRAIGDYRKNTGATVIIVSHSMEDLARLCDKLLVLSKGKKIMFGSVSEVFSKSDELINLGLDVPMVTKVLLELKKMGVSVDTNAFTLEKAVSNIISARKGDA